MMPYLILFFSGVGMFLLAAYVLQKFLSQDNVSGPEDAYFEVKTMVDSDGV